MREFLKRYSRPSAYRLASLTLVLLLVSLPIGIAGLGGPEWLAALICLPIFVVLVILTYGRLLDAHLSAGWLALMVLGLNFGPAWQGPAWLVFHASHLIYLIPVVLGCLVQKLPPKANGSLEVG